jgi:ABC-type uncharacterized transport system permease subunit
VIKLAGKNQLVNLITHYRLYLYGRGKQAITAIQLGFSVLLLAYFGSKFVLERLLS